jgi:hypothetical protein
MNKIFVYSNMTEYTNLPIKGQGIIVFKTYVHDNAMFTIYDSDKLNMLRIVFSTTHVDVTMVNNSHTKILADPLNTSGLVYLHGAYFWFSLDSQNQKLYAGIGEPRSETIIYTYTFDSNELNKMFLESLSHVSYSKTRSNVHIIRISKDPITNSTPLIVKDTNDLTMMDIAKMTYIPKANLSTISQKLYDCISGTKFVLDDTGFPDFSKAIEYSIVTEGCWCNTVLKKKATEFNKDAPNINETYLRITLGSNNGESPGIPYVMEIWPSGHYSPIHSHAGANAIIRVLYGEIHVKLFPFLCYEKEGIPIFGEADFKKDEITWISPTLNQTHQLENKCSTTCVTIQCYMYDDDNKRHYDYFDYIDINGDKQQYEPDSDMDFVLFKQTMYLEWTNKKGNKKSHNKR